MYERLLLATMAPLALLAAPALAGEADPLAAPLAAPYRAKIEDATERGRAMFLYDQAAWHATDRMLADFDGKPDERLRGYVILPGETDKTLSAVFFGDVDGKHVEFARYDVAFDTVVSATVFDEGERPALPQLGERLIAARDMAITELDTQKYGFCNRSQPNYVLLPPGDDGIISVYFLTPQTENGSYPLGGHYRIDIGADGQVVGSRRFMNSCFNVDLANRKDEHGESMRPTAAVVTHLLDPQPTELHIFASYYLPLELMVATTGNNLVWDIRDGRVIDVASIADAHPAKD